jgi:hypothetical protein
MASLELHRAARRILTRAWRVYDIQDAFLARAGFAGSYPRGRLAGDAEILRGVHFAACARSRADLGFDHERAAEDAYLATLNL